MLLLSTSDLAYMRTVVADMFPDTCAILSETMTPDGQGGVSSTWGTVAGTVACRLDSTTTQGNSLAVAGGGQKVAHQFVLSFPYNGTISPGNRVEVGGATYTVVSVNDNQSWMAVGRATLELIG